MFFTEPINAYEYHGDSSKTSNKFGLGTSIRLLLAKINHNLREDQFEFEHRRQQGQQANGLHLVVLHA
ncbi:hypothetical protein EUGRSUZ_K03457 [Eucalyptus grandis]|uniref:Uncharacterized protein n=2 Tax=Eucalyptus grandis TaxID=71139 RepID=A0ACC3J2G0_EUCGR|nr:hypothetical protein EUGRSUZ_K03457 [Eucalyptus grandis]